MTMMSKRQAVTALRRQAARFMAAETRLADARAERDDLWLHAREAGVTSIEIAAIYGVNQSRVAQVTGPIGNGRGKAAAS